MGWRMCHCSKCGRWQSAEKGTFCSKCKIDMDLTEYLADKFPPSEDRVTENNLKFDRDNDLWEDINYNEKKETEDVYKENYPLQRDITRLAKDVRFMANVLRVYIIITLLAAFFGIIAWFWMVA